MEEVPHCLCKEGLCVLRLSLGVNFLDLLRAAFSFFFLVLFFALSLGMPLVSVIKP